MDIHNSVMHIFNVITDIHNWIMAILFTTVMDIHYLIIDIHNSAMDIPWIFP